MASISVFLNGIPEYVNEYVYICSFWEFEKEF